MKRNDVLLCGVERLPRGVEKERGAYVFEVSCSSSEWINGTTAAERLE
jgi:hypothetical protein